MVLLERTRAKAVRAPMIVDLKHLKPRGLTNPGTNQAALTRQTRILVTLWILPVCAPARGIGGRINYWVAPTLPSVVGLTHLAGMYQTTTPDHRAGRSRRPEACHVVAMARALQITDVVPYMQWPTTPGDLALRTPVAPFRPGSHNNIPSMPSPQSERTRET